MNFSFETLRPDYEQWISQAVLLPVPERQAQDVAKRLLLSKDRFLTLQKTSGVPALWVMPVFERENPSFSTYLGNGDSLSRATVHVPKHRGPFGSWEEGALDALALDGITGHADWNWPFACYMWEKWNGFGPRQHGRPTGYVTAGTNIYQGGKYIADGEWSRGTWDHQLGTIIIAKALVALSPDLDFSATPVAPPIPPQAKLSASPSHPA